MDLDDGHCSYHCNLAPKVPACSATCIDIASCHFCQVYMPYNYNTILKIQGTGIYNLALVLPVLQGKKSCQCGKATTSYISVSSPAKMFPRIMRAGKSAS